MRVPRIAAVTGLTCGQPRTVTVISHLIVVGGVQ